MNIFVNGRKFDLPGKSPSVDYDQIVSLAGLYTGRHYTVTYRFGDSGGTLLPTNILPVSEGAIFNVADTSST